MSRRKVPLLSIGFAILACGCSIQTKEPEQVHHEFPDHRPANFSDAVDEIELRIERWRHSGGITQVSESDETGFEELIDIVDWIPEMAADSDLRRDDWEKANAAATVLRMQLQEEAPAEFDAIQSNLEVLRSLVSAAGPPEPNLYRDHDADDDHNQDQSLERIQLE